MTMLSTCCTLTKTVFTLLLVAATYQLATTAPIVRRETSNCPTGNPPSEAHLRNGLLVTSKILNSTVQQDFNTTNNNDTVAIERACNLLTYYYRMNESNNLLFKILERTILDACTHWVNFNCTLEDLKEFGQRCHSVRLLNLINEAYDKTDIAFNGLDGSSSGCPTKTWVTHLKKSYNLTSEQCTTLSNNVRAINFSDCS